MATRLDPKVLDALIDAGREGVGLGVRASDPARRARRMRARAARLDGRAANLLRKAEEGPANRRDRRLSRAAGWEIEAASLRAQADALDPPQCAED